jgi:hypothetical protein
MNHSESKTRNESSFVESLKQPQAMPNTIRNFSPGE